MWPEGLLSSTNGETHSLAWADGPGPTCGRGIELGPAPLSPLGAYPDGVTAGSGLPALTRAKETQSRTSRSVGWREKVRLRPGKGPGTRVPGNTGCTTDDPICLANSLQGFSRMWFPGRPRGMPEPMADVFMMSVQRASRLCSEAPQWCRFRSLHQQCF